MRTGAPWANDCDDVGRFPPPRSEVTAPDYLRLRLIRLSTRNEREAQANQALCHNAFALFTEGSFEQR
jgi:hypothetical protein